MLRKLYRWKELSTDGLLREPEGVVSAEKYDGPKNTPNDWAAWPIGSYKSVKAAESGLRVFMQKTNSMCDYVLVEFYTVK